jgi:hypothetical protein
MLNASTGAIGFYAFDPAGGYNDLLASSFYSFKVEDIQQGRTATISRVIVTYRDLGLVTAVFTLMGTQDNIVVGGLTGASSMQAVQLGNALATGKLMTKFVDVSLTGQNLQLIVVRAAGAGALSIAKVLMCGRVEDAVYA